ncbi:hypothetical protein PS710_01233 [Pseudomonas fluorescens]|uniref:Uncharacterized protein n=1 Tax=Pseudomonas fluorescens TaxID=294 RepID=A0A5E7AVB4_PSEFL|nr:hypothetical protein PS710_01233 [Pseudomonas fluorescens]
MPVALSVDALCGFGAENLDRCADITQDRPLENLHTSLLISHFGVFCIRFGSVLVRLDEKCPKSGRLFMLRLALTGFGVKHTPIAGMLPSCRLVHRLTGRALS